MRCIKYVTVAFSFIFFQNSFAGESDLEVPSYKLQKISVHDSYPSSKPELLMGQLEYKSSASTEELLKFYKENPYVKSCEYSTTGENYQCELNKYKKIYSGTIYIAPKSENGLTTVFSDYFYLK